MEKYKSNSHKQRTVIQSSENKKVTRIAGVNAKRKKRTPVGGATVTFFAEARNVIEYVTKDVILPAVKDMTYDALSNGLKMVLYPNGEKKSRGRSNAHYVSYSDYSRRNADRYEPKRERKHEYTYDDIIVDTRSEAEEILTTMQGILDTYNVVTVMDLYDLVGIEGQYTDNKYGWTSIKSAEPIRVREGYWIKMPKAYPID